MKNTSLHEVSSFLTEEVVQRAFRQKTGSEEAVVSVQLSRASAPGEGLMSAVHRLLVRGDAHSASFVVKSLVKDKLLRKSLNSEKYFQRETLFFTKILPTLVNIQKTLGAKERIQDIVPTCYAAHCDGENDFILMEDMFDSGYRPINKEVSEAERESTLKVLAHLHAVSIALRVKGFHVFDDIAKHLPEIYYTEKARDWYSKYLSMAIEFDKKVISEFESPSSIYYKKFIEAVSSDVYGDLIELTTRKSVHRAIMHGDAWCANFLCTEGKAVAIDFQLVRCASPATELSYFILICSNLCRKKNDFEEAVNIYYNGLKYYLADMGLCSEKIFSKNQLDQELKEYGRFGLLACLTSFLLSSSTDKFDTLEIVSTNDSEYENIIPLEKLWKLSDFKEEDDKMKLVNAVRVAVDVGII